jgi:hypothetical protein
MISQEQANPAAEQPECAPEPGRAETPGSGGACGLPFDYIDEELEETMIASDPPALAPQTAIGPPGHEEEPGRSKDR